MHINFLELLAAIQVAKTFLKDVSGVSLLLQLSNTTAVVQATNNIIDIWDWAFWNKIPNGSDHAIVACYFEFYEKGEVEHINGPTHPSQQQRFAFKGWGVIMQLGIYMDLFMHAHAVSGTHYMYIDHQAVDGQISLICLTSPSSYNCMQLLHDLSHWEMLVYSLCYYSFPVFSWECWSTLLLNASSIIPIIKIILVLTFHIIANLVQLLLTKPQLITLSSTLTLALIWPQNSKAKPISSTWGLDY